ncbi:BadF/BadG/BcrA/BcrD ATPase family protein [Kitasatospora sp. NPDC092286]|uniref:BadF/BadG/BcrA/BcrD ATPase family protein n=1 Tax=Kitasatospora sp. NPDC092286 TaxID=3364087 RepID=UPI00381B8D96
MDRTSAQAEAAGGSWVIGIDVGGSGIRLALAPDAWPADLSRARTVELASPARISGAGHDADALLGRLLPALGPLAASVRADGRADGRTGGCVSAVAIGATGMALLGRDLAAKLPAPLARATGAGRLVLAGDAISAYAGALGARPGVAVAAGTGLVAIGFHPDTGWRRADGWGQLLGDCGGGAWIGRAGLEAALRAYDGRAGGSPALLESAERRYGPVTGLPAALQPRPDRAALLAAFAPEVAMAAEAGCVVAGGIVRRAGEEIAVSAAAAAGAAALTEPQIALTGGLFNLPSVRGAAVATLAAVLPAARPRRPDGPPLLGALRLAATAAAPPWPLDPPLLDVRTWTG